MVHGRQQTAWEAFETRPDLDADVHERVVLRLEVGRLRRELSELSELERSVLGARFGIGCRQRSRRAVAASLQLPVGDVRRLETQALARLRRAYTIGAEEA